MCVCLCSKHLRYVLGIRTVCAVETVKRIDKMVTCFSLPRVGRLNTDEAPDYPA